MYSSRRDFVKAGTAALACTSALLETVSVHAAIKKLPLGLQLYSVRDLLPKDYAGTLKEVGKLGFKEVESAGYYDHSAAEVKQAMADANLRLVSAHYAHDPLSKDMDQIIDFHHQLGVDRIVCSSPGHAPNHPAGEKGFTLDDWRWNADQFNKFGEKLAAAKIKFAYHNHIAEFHATDGVVPYVELMRLTDPKVVSFEMDCGWVIVGGGDPVKMLQTYPTRIVMLHVKDFKLADKDAKGEPKVEELGLGTVDFHPIFEAASKTGHIEHIFVEQEAFNVAPMESLKIDANFMHKVGAA
jgi:sugar phosphate isomerase/epimerase